MDAPEVLAQAYIDPEKGVETIEDALAGASDILAERISDDAEVRKSLRTLMNRRGTARSAAAKDEEDDKTAVYRQYFEFSPAHFPFTKPSGSGTQPRRTRGGLEGQPVR